MVRASGFYKSPPLSSEIPKLLLLCYLIFPIRNSWWKCETQPNMESEKLFFFFNSIWTLHYWDNKNKTVHTEGGNKIKTFQDLTNSAQIITVRGAVQKGPRPSPIAQRFPSAKRPVAPSSEPEPEWKLVWKLVSCRRPAAEQGGEKPEGGLPWVFAIITKAETAAGWHRAPQPSAVQADIQRAK